MKLTAEQVHGGHIHVRADGCLIGDLMPFVDQLDAVVKAINIADATVDLLAACKDMLERWQTAGPNGSHQFEKFDAVIRQMRIAVEKAEESK